MNFAKTTNLKSLLKKADYRNPSMWEKILAELPDGSELVFDDSGALAGVVVQFKVMFDQDIAINE